MHSRIATVAFHGIETIDVEVQVHITNGSPSMAIDGLADKSVPADVLKEGAHFDLPIAVPLLLAMGVMPEDSVIDCLILRELSLNGSLQPLSGVLSAALAASVSDCRLIFPAACDGEAAWAGSIDVIAPNYLTSLLNHLRGTQTLTPPSPHVEADQSTPLDMADLKGQETTRRAIEIAAAGRHNFLVIGPAGAGKSMLAARLPGLLPALDAREALEVTMLHSVAGQLSACRSIQ